MPLPVFNSAGLLPPGIHDCSLDDAHHRFVINPHRAQMWSRFLKFVDWTRSLNSFDILYLDGGYISDKAKPQDIDVILQTRAPYGTAALESMIPFFHYGTDKILEEYGVHIHFWSEGFPGGVNDFRLFFQYLRPQDAAPRGLQAGATKGIVKINIRKSAAIPAPAQLEEATL